MWKYRKNTNGKIHNIKIKISNLQDGNIEKTQKEKFTTQKL